MSYCLRYRAIGGKRVNQKANGQLQNTEMMSGEGNLKARLRSYYCTRKATTPKDLDKEQYGRARQARVVFSESVLDYLCRE